MYGEGGEDGYTIELDGNQTTQTSSVISAPGLLFSQSDLTYGPHSLVLRVQVVQPGVTISNAIITTGMGEVGTMVQSRTIDTTTVPLTTNDFTLSDGWISQSIYNSITDPRVGTTTSGASLSFPLTSASAFYIVGSVNFNHGLFYVTVTPPSNIGPQMKGEYNGSSYFFGLGTMLYLATGLNRSQTYQIEMANDSPSLWLDISSVVVCDTPPPSSSQVSQASPGSSHALRTSAIVGIVFGGGCVLVAFVIFLFYVQRRRRRQQNTGLPSNFMTEPDPLPTAGLGVQPALPSTPFPWVDYPPNAQSEHSSVPVWAVNQHQRMEEPQWMQGPGSSTPSTFQQTGQFQTMHGGFSTPKTSTSPDFRSMSVSDRSSVPIDQEESRAVSSLVDGVPAPDNPPAYKMAWEDYSSRS